MDIKIISDECHATSGESMYTLSDLYENQVRALQGAFTERLAKLAIEEEVSSYDLCGIDNRLLDLADEIDEDGGQFSRSAMEDIIATLTTYHEDTADQVREHLRSTTYPG